MFRLDEFEKYRQLALKGATPQSVYLVAKSDNLSSIPLIRLLRTLYNLSIVEAKDVIVKAEKQDVSLDQYQSRLISALEELIIEEN